MSAVAVSEGTTRQASIDAGPFRVSEVVFPPDHRLPWHAHPYGCVAVVVDGVVGKRFRQLEADAGAGSSGPRGRCSRPTRRSHSSPSRPASATRATSRARSGGSSASPRRGSGRCNSDSSALVGVQDTRAGDSYGGPMKRIVLLTV